MAHGKLETQPLALAQRLSQFPTIKLILSGVWCCDRTPKCAVVTQYIWKIVRDDFLGLLVLAALAEAITASDLSMKLRVASFGFLLHALFIATAIYIGRGRYLILSMLSLIASVMVPIIVAALHLDIFFYPYH